MTDVDAATHVVAAARREAYSKLSLRGGPSHVPLVASELDEPPFDSTCVEMLEVLSGTEADYYTNERNVLDWLGKATSAFKEIESYYDFVGAPMPNTWRT